MCSHYSTQRTNILDVLSTFIWDSYSYSFNRHRLQLHTTCRKILMKWVTTFPSKKINSYSIFTHPPANVCTWASDKKLQIHRNLRSPWRRYYYRICFSWSGISQTYFCCALSEGREGKKSGDQRKLRTTAGPLNLAVYKAYNPMCHKAETIEHPLKMEHNAYS